MEKLITSSFAPLLLILLLHLTLSPATQAELNIRVSNCSSTDGNYTATSVYKTNLDNLFRKVTTTSLDSGFYNFTAGHSTDKANLISLCLGNVNVTACHTCQSFVIDKMKGLCPNEMTAIAWSDDCFVRYSKDSIFATLAESPGYLLLSGAKAPDNVVTKYSDLVKTLLQGLPGNASAGDSQMKFADAQAEFNSSVTLYTAAQCTPDLSRMECLSCLNDATSAYQKCEDCKGHRGARVLSPSCMVRFEEYKFYVSSHAGVPSASPGPSPSVGTGPSMSPSPSPSVGPGPSMSPSPSVTPVPSTSPSVGPGPSMSPSPSVTPVPSTSPSVGPGPSMSPSPSVTPDPSTSPPVSPGPSDNSSGNGVKERIGSRFSVVAIAVVGACLSALV